MDLFDRDDKKPASTGPLADRMRPRTIDEYVGQEHLVGEGRFLARVIERG
jgi:putative ATPase